MPIPRIAIVGRPNVGKSSLLNLIARERIAIVDDVPGVTRDRVAAVVDLEPPGEGPVKAAEVVDTGGFGVYVAQGRRYDEVGHDLTRLTGDIERQIGEAVATADLILFAVDAQAGVTPGDEEIARMLREQRLGRGKKGRGAASRPGDAGGGGGEGGESGGAQEDRSESGPTRAGTGSGPAQEDRSETGPTQSGPARQVPVRVVATKVDGESWEPHAYELAALGFDEPLLVSPKTKYLRRDFLERLYELLPEPAPEDERIAEADMRIAIVGKRNAGKSTLINALAGEERVIVSEIPGTTRDSVDVRFDFGDRSVVAIDTAGLRRRKSFQGRVEHYAFDRLERSIKRAEVVVLVIDALEKVSQVDEKLAQIIAEQHKPCVIAVNKWDAAAGRATGKGQPVTAEDYDEYLRRELKALDRSPIALISARERLNVEELVDLCFELKAQAAQRVGTGELNRVVRGVLEQRGPSSKLGTEAKVLFVSQVRSSPPTIVMVVNHPELFRPNYVRYLMNRLHEALPFEEVPIRLIIRGRRKRDEDLDGRRPRGREPVPTGEEGAEPDLEALLEELPDDPSAYFDE